MTLSTGHEVEVLPLSWGGYKGVKVALKEFIESFEVAEFAAEFLSAISGMAARFLPAAIDSETDTTDFLTSFLEKWGSGDTVRRLPALLAEAITASDELTQQFVDGCCPGLDWKLCRAADVLALRQAAMEVNPLVDLLAAEKNFFRSILLPAESAEPAAAAIGSMP